MRKITKITALMLAATMLCACGESAGTSKQGDDNSPAAEQTVDANNPLGGDREKLISFDYADVTLSDGLFKDTYDACMAYYDSLTADDILYRWRMHSDMDTKTGRDLGWEAGITNPECCIAQLISAKARRYAVTQSEADLQLVSDILTGYQEIIDKTGSYPLMYSAYFYEKTLRAFIDIYECCHLEPAYDMAKDFMSYGMSNVPFKEPETLLGDNGTEWYTMSEAIYMFAELAKEKGESAALIRQYTDWGKKYEYTEFWDIFYNDEDLFDYKVQVDRPYNQYFHAYSHLNSFNSALEAYKNTGKSYYLDATKKFYDWAEKTQKLATGGYGAEWEWLLPSDYLVSSLRTTSRSTETQCNAYAIVNLDNRLMAYTADGYYGEWMEDDFYNMTIASLETENGEPTYYSDYSSDGGTKYLREDWPWACCAGTRPLVVMEYLRNIYYNDTKNLYVNLYTNSSIAFKNCDDNEIRLTQDSSYPEESDVNFTVNTTKESEFALYFREPTWLAGDAVITVNGEQTEYTNANGWMVVKRTWKDGDTVTVSLPMNLYYSIVQNADDETDAVYAVKYGPVTLACDGVVSGLSSVLPVDGDVNSLLTRQDGSMDFVANDNDSIVFRPYYTYEKGKTYILYISTK